MKYIAYYRVSTQRQGQSGLGLEAQKAEVARFTQGHELLAEFTEIESGRNNHRPQLNEAINLCLEHSATLVIAKLDRLSRNVLFIETLKNKGVKFVCCDMPEANEFIIGVMAQLAQYERKLISDRTKAALKAYKDRGGKLGGSTPEHCNAMRAAKKPVKHDEHLIYIIRAEREKNTPFKAIADKLNSLGHRTNRSKPHTATSVFRIFSKL